MERSLSPPVVPQTDSPILLAKDKSCRIRRVQGVIDVLSIRHSRNLPMKLLVSIAVSAVVLLGGPTVASGPTVEVKRGTLAQETVQEETRWHGWVPGGQVVEINNVHGNVRAELAEGDEIEVIAQKHGMDSPERVAIEVVEHKGGVTICAVYPNANADHPFDCRPSHGGGFRTAATSDSEAHIRWENGGGGDVLLNDLRSEEHTSELQSQF